MPQINVSASTRSQIVLLARAWNTTEDGAIGRLLTEFQAGDEAREDPVDNGAAAIHADYQGFRTTALFDRTTHRVTITNGPLEGQSWKSPSGAAVALIREANPSIRAERNGWGFWIVTATGEVLQSLR